jgi:hypothetical protein
MKRHWNLAYLISKIKTGIYYSFNIDKPWLTKDANNYLIKHLTPEMAGLEFGSGRSTVFLAKRLKKLVSIESSKKWYSKVGTMLQTQNIKNVDYRFVSNNELDPMRNDYPAVADEFNDNYFDFILVDGSKRRDLCTLKAVRKLKQGGILVLDNANWFLPSSSLAPNSIPLNGDFNDEAWKLYPSRSN